MAFVYIALSVACSLAIAHFLKLVRKSNLRVLNVLTVNYLAAVLISLAASPEGSFLQGGIPDYIYLFAGILGLIFISNFWVYSASLNKMGMGISIAAMRMSLVIPISLSLFIYLEPLKPVQYAGIALVLLAFYLMLPRFKGEFSAKRTDSFFPVLLFLMTGIADASMKFYERELISILPEYSFLSLIFLSAFIIGVIALLVRKELDFSIKEVFYGFVIGLANLYTSFFLISALGEMPGSVVFPLVNVSNVVIGAIIGILFWKDSLTIKQKAGLITAILSILILVG